MGDIDGNKHKLVKAVAIEKYDVQVSRHYFFSQKNGIRATSSKCTLSRTIRSLR